MLESQLVNDITSYLDKYKIRYSKEIHIDENLGIDEAPQGFFDQYASETEQILQAGYKNMKTKRGGRQ